MFLKRNKNFNQNLKHVRTQNFFFIGGGGGGADVKCWDIIVSTKPIFFLISNLG